uniref:helix-turn-helix domain-containing protein n=1 Tax=Agathobacter sp. TaxID=2021311 RepID=UPI004056E34E
MSDIRIGERIRELRELQSYTREAFAEKVDISAKFLYEIETGKRGFSADTLGRISVALSVSCDYIMFGEENGHYSGEKIMCVLENMKPAQLYRIQNILQMLCEMCDSV